MESQACAASRPTLWVERVSLNQIKVLLLLLSASATAPTVLLTTGFIYAQMSLGMNVKPEHIVAGVLLVLSLSFYILWREARRVFELIDAVPALKQDMRVMQGKVDGMQGKMDSVASSMDEIRDIGQKILARDDNIAWRLDRLEKIEAEQRWRRE